MWTSKEPEEERREWGKNQSEKVLASRRGARVYFILGCEISTVSRQADLEAWDRGSMLMPKCGLIVSCITGHGILGWSRQKRTFPSIYSPRRVDFGTEVYSPFVHDNRV